MFDAIQYDTTPKYDSRDPFYGIACDKLIESYSPYKDGILGDFVFFPVLRINIYHVWMG